MTCDGVFRYFITTIIELKELLLLALPSAGHHGYKQDRKLRPSTATPWPTRPKDRVPFTQHKDEEANFSGHISPPSRPWILTRTNRFQHHDVL